MPKRVAAKAIRSCRRTAVAFVIAMCAAGAATAQATLPEPIVKSTAFVIDALHAGDFAAIETRFDAAMHRLLPHDKFMATGAQIIAQTGALQDCDEPRGRPRDGLTAVEVRCRFANGPALVRLAWTESLELGGLLILPVPLEPAGPAPLPPDVREESVTTGAPGWPLPGTILLPTGRSRPPIVVLVHGSGPNDRDETIGPNRPFLDLALGFAQHGIASLRYEKRTRALGARFAAELKDYTLDDEVVADAVAALRQVSRRDDVGPVFVVGHSEGAWLAPRIAAEAAKQRVKVAGIVMLAAPLTSFGDLIVYQYEFLSKLPQPTVTPDMLDEIRLRRANLQRLLDQGTLGVADPVKASVVAHAPLPLDAPASMWLDMGRFDPAGALLVQPGLPALLTFGTRDFQVPIREKGLWEKRLEGRSGTTIVEFPAMNHLLIDGAGQMSPSEYVRAGHVSDALIDRVAAWIGERAAAH